MINPHVILLTEENIPAILCELPQIEPEVLQELLEDAVKEGTFYYIVAYRAPSHILTWKTDTAVQFEELYGYNPSVHDGSRYFVKIRPRVVA